jgi:hypothetical protein
MEVVRHQTASQHPHGDFLAGLLHQPLEPRVVVVIVEYARSTVSPADHVKTEAARRNASNSGHLIIPRRLCGTDA